MRKINIADITLREYSDSLTFKEKVEIAKLLDRLQCDVIEMPEIKNVPSDFLLIKTISRLVSYSEISVPAGTDKEKIAEIFSLTENAKKSSLKVSLPVSTVQMEYLFSKKPAAIMSMITELVSECKKYTDNVEFSALDALRAEKEFLYDAVNAAIEAGATKITVCDCEGISLPDEFGKYIDDLYKNVDKLKNVTLSAEIRSRFKMASACGVYALKSGVTEIKTATDDIDYPVFENAVNVLKNKNDDLDISFSVNTTEIKRLAAQINKIIHPVKTDDIPAVSYTENEKTELSKDDDISTVIKAVEKIGYDLSPEDKTNVYEAFKRVASKKDYVKTRELEAIIASSVLQVPETYSIDSYIINSGNVINATANIKLIKDGKELSGVSVGDGPIDASFMAIEQIIGHHYELDDFQIRSVTRGREAMGSAIVKLRSSEEKLYSGQGISTDIIGASIRAYVNALNKIAYEEG